MARINTVVKGYTGIRAGVAFVNGSGETEDPHLIAWFREHGYEVVEEQPKEPDPEPLEPGTDPMEPDPDPMETETADDAAVAEEPTAVAPAQRKGRKKEG